MRINEIRRAETSSAEWWVSYHIDKRSVKFETRSKAMAFIESKYDEGFRNIEMEFHRKEYKRSVFGAE